MTRILTIAAFVLMAFVTAYSAYRVVAIDAWLSATVATRVDERGVTQPLNRADALAYFLSEDVRAAHAKESGK